MTGNVRNTFIVTPWSSVKVVVSVTCTLKVTDFGQGRLPLFYLGNTGVIGLLQIRATSSWNGYFTFIVPRYLLSGGLE